MPKACSLPGEVGNSRGTPAACSSPCTLSLLHQVVSGSVPWLGKLVFEKLILWFQCYAIAESIWLSGMLLMDVVLGLGQGVPSATPPCPGLDECQCTLSGSELILAVTNCPCCLPCHKKNKPILTESSVPTEFGSSAPASPVWIKHLL